MFNPWYWESAEGADFEQSCLPRTSGGLYRMNGMGNEFSSARKVAAVSSAFFSVLFAFELVRPRLSPPYDPGDVHGQAIELVCIVLWAVLGLVLGFIGLHNNSRPFHLLALFSIALPCGFVIILTVARLLVGG